MSRSVSIAANAGEVQLPNGVVLGGTTGKTSTVLTDAQWSQISGSTLVSGGTLIDGGATSNAPEQSTSNPESDPVAENDLGLLFNIATKTANYTLTSSDRTIISNGTSLTHTLPTAASAKKGKEYRVKNIAATAATVNVSGGGNIDGAATSSVAQWGVGRYITDGTAWYTA